MNKDKLKAAIIGSAVASVLEEYGENMHGIFTEDEINLIDQSFDKLAEEFVDENEIRSFI